MPAAGKLQEEARQSLGILEEDLAAGNLQQSQGRLQSGLGCWLGQDQTLKFEHPVSLVRSHCCSKFRGKQRVLAVLAYPEDNPGQHSLVADKVVGDMSPAPMEGIERFEDSHL